MSHGSNDRLRKDPSLTLYRLFRSTLNKLLCWLENQNAVEHWHMPHRKYFSPVQLLSFLPHQQIHNHHSNDDLDNPQRIYLSKYYLAQPLHLLKRYFQTQSIPNCFVDDSFLFRSLATIRDQTFDNPCLQHPFTLMVALYHISS